ncbi:carbohydrate ABC transporter permease [Actinoplanes sp. KI2]|uniref:carbohydrate ABC transporter permease n=1 Tax=Actinoplanes sp. KI2 TaxID=2983315 RepID=UPI0021D5AD6B|nr:carbohydrate ABC transporter permease [Actinoplanes sp. KI2]MCU7729650.1 carbohydrate ABC transporter permease [Actinoplanes sp. KI2]
MSTPATTSSKGEPTEQQLSVEPTPRNRLRMLILAVGAVVFIFPFYYMVIGSLQAEADKSFAGVLPQPDNMTVRNYQEINEAIDAPRALVNSTVFTIGVLLCTVVFGILAGYALAVMHFRGRTTVLSAVLLVLVIPFQLLQIPLYVLIVRAYGLGDTYLGMIIPFAINSTAVFIFRQFFLQLPRELFEAARIDGASELKTMLRIAIPLARPAILNAVLLTFIGPWNEFLWPFLVTKQQNMQPFAVALANYMNNVAGRATNPDGANMAGGVLLAIPPVVLFLIFQKRFTSTNIGSGVKG